MSSSMSQARILAGLKTFLWEFSGLYFEEVTDEQAHEWVERRAPELYTMLSNELLALTPTEKKSEPKSSKVSSTDWENLRPDGTRHRGTVNESPKP